MRVSFMTSLFSWGLYGHVHYMPSSLLSLSISLKNSLTTMIDERLVTGILLLIIREFSNGIVMPVPSER